MERGILKAFVLAAGVVAIMLSAGCEEQQQLPSTKMSRLIAAENIQLKKQLELRDKDIEELKQLQEKELKKQKELLAKCQGEKRDLDAQLAGKYGDKINTFFNTVVEDTGRLQQENKSLKAEIEKLKAQIEELEARPEEQEKLAEQTAELL